MGWDGILCGAELRRKRREEDAIHDQPRWCKKCGKLVKSHRRFEKSCSLSVKVEDPMLDIPPALAMQAAEGKIRLIRCLTVMRKRRRISTTDQDSLSELVRDASIWNHARRWWAAISNGAELRVEPSLRR